MGVRVELTQVIVSGGVEVTLASLDAHAHALFHSSTNESMRGLAAAVMALVDYIETLEKPGDDSAP